MKKDIRSQVDPKENSQTRKQTSSSARGRRVPRKSKGLETQLWRLICPPKNWQNPIDITEQDLDLLVEVGRRLNLVVNRNESQQKLYLGPVGGTLGLADGGLADGETGSSTQISLESEVGFSLAGDAVLSTAGLRFPSGWVAEVIEDGVAGPGFKAVDPLAAAPLISAFPDAQLSKNFRLSEFRPGRHSFPYVRISPALVRTLEEIRERAGGPVHITSGYRPPDYNREIGGVSNSTHIDGLAADIFCDALSTARLYDICEAIIGHRGGVGYYPKQQFVHVDLRGYQARWSGL